MYAYQSDIKTEIQPPKKPSEQIEMAIKDMTSIIDRPDFIIDMDSWMDFEPVDEDSDSDSDVERENKDNGTCHVCFAGTVMAGTLDVELGWSYTPFSFDSTWPYVFCFLDEVRGCVLTKDYIENHLEVMGYNASEIEAFDTSDIEITHVAFDQENPANFLNAMKNMQMLCEARGF